MTNNKIIETELPCPLTGSHAARIVAEKDRSGDPLRTVMCIDSGLVYVDPRPTAEETRTFYTHDYRLEYKQSYIPKSKHIVRAGAIASKRIQTLKKQLSIQGKLLDVGSGGGEFVYLAGKAGFDANGVEPNTGYAEFSQNAYGISVYNNFIQDIDVLDDSYDIITLFHVLEHLNEPVTILMQLSKKLKRGGYLMVEVPNVLYTCTAPQQKWHVGPLFHFNDQTLQTAGMLAGLVPEFICVNNDGGNLTAFFRKPQTAQEPPENCNELLENSAEKTLKVLAGHTTFRHFAQAHIPLFRVIKKISRTISEYIFVCRHSTPKDILDSIAQRKV